MKSKYAVLTMLFVLIVAAIPAAAVVGDEGPSSLTDFAASGQPVPDAAPAAASAPAAAPEAVAFYYDRPTFDGDFPGLPVEDYENANVNPTDILGFGMPLDENTDNGIFSPGDILPGISFSASEGDLGSELVILGGASGFGETSKTVLANRFVASYIIEFDPPVEAAGMDLQTLLGSYSCQVDVFNAAGGLLGTDTSYCDEPGAFWGVASDGDPIAQIVIYDAAGGAEGADNIAFGDGAGGSDTMHVHDITGFQSGGRLVMKVQVADQDHIPLTGVMVDADITTPTIDWARWRYTNLGGYARFWAPIMYAGNYEICVTDLTLDGYTYEPGDNVYTCMDWDLTN